MVCSDGPPSCVALANILICDPNFSPSDISDSVEMITFVVERFNSVDLWYASSGAIELISDLVSCTRGRLLSCFNTPFVGGAGSIGDEPLLLLPFGAELDSDATRITPNFMRLLSSSDSAFVSMLKFPIRNEAHVSPG